MNFFNHKIGLIFASIIAMVSVACGGSVQTHAPATPVAETVMAETPVFTQANEVYVIEGTPAPNTTRHRVNSHEEPAAKYSSRNTGVCHYEVRGTSFDNREDAEAFGKKHRMNGAIVEERCDNLGRSYYSEFHDRNPIAVVTSFNLDE